MSNRAERRREHRSTTKVATYNMRLSDITQIASKQVEEDKGKLTDTILQTASKGIIVAFVMALESELGFKRKRIDRVLKRTRTTFDAMQSGDINTQQMLEYCKDNLGVEL